MAMMGNDADVAHRPPQWRRFRQFNASRASQAAANMSMLLKEEMAAAAQGRAPLTQEGGPGVVVPTDTGVSHRSIDYIAPIDMTLWEQWTSGFTSGASMPSLVGSSHDGAIREGRASSQAVTGGPEGAGGSSGGAAGGEEGGKRATGWWSAHYPAPIPSPVPHQHPQPQLPATAPTTTTTTTPVAAPTLTPMPASAPAPPPAATSYNNITPMEGVPHSGPTYATVPHSHHTLHSQRHM